MPRPRRTFDPFTGAERRDHGESPPVWTTEARFWDTDSTEKKVGIGPRRRTRIIEGRDNIQGRRIA